MKNTLLITLVPMLFILVFLGIWLYVQFTHLSHNTNVEKISILNLSNNCNLHDSICTVNLPDGNGSFSLETDPRPVQTAKKHTLKLSYNSDKLVPVYTDFNVEDMDMGFNRPTFFKRSEGTYNLDFVLPVCTIDAMYWRALVVFESKDKTKLGVPFYFWVKRYGR